MRWRVLVAVGLLTIGVLVVCGRQPSTVRLAGTTLALIAAVSAVVVPLGTLLAFLLFRTDMPLRRGCLTSWCAWLFVPIYGQAAAWDAGGGLRTWLAALSRTDWLVWQRWCAVVTIYTSVTLPWVILIVGMALRRVATELEEDARLMKPWWWVALRVTLRQALTGPALAVVWIAVVVTTDMTVTDLYQLRTIAEQVYTGFATAESVAAIPGLGVALGLTLLLAGLIAIGASQIVTPAPISSAAGSTPYELRRWRWPAALVCGAVLVITVGLPLARLVHQAGLVVDRQPHGYVRFWSLHRFSELLLWLPGRLDRSVLWRFRYEFGWTFALTAIVATLDLVIAVPIAWWVRRRDWPWWPVATCAAIGLATPGPLVGLAVIWVFTLSSATWCVWVYDQTLAAPAVALAWRSLPVAILACCYSVRRIPDRLIEMATLDGLRPAAELWHLAVRPRGAFLAMTWLVCAAIVFGDLAASILVVPPGVMTLPIRVFNLLHAGVDDQVAAVSLVSVGIAGLLGIIILFFSTRSLRSRRQRSTPQCTTGECVR